MTVVIPTPTIPEAMGMGVEEGERAAHTPKALYPVLYLLHGLGNNQAQWTGYTKAELYAEEHQIALVCMAGENNCYITVDGSDDYYRFMTEELPDLVTGLFPVSKRPEDTYIAGLSMGGYGSIICALNQPERYGAMGAFSAATIASDNYPGCDDRYKCEWLVNHIREEGISLPKIYMSCGMKDPFHKVNSAYRDELREAGADVTWDEMEEYGHEWRFWDNQLEKFISWLPRTDAYAGKKRKV